jgi:hypothetical protein
MPLSPADFSKFIADETEKWGKVIPRGQSNARIGLAVTAPIFHISRSAK